MAFPHTVCRRPIHAARFQNVDDGHRSEENEEWYAGEQQAGLVAEHRGGIMKSGRLTRKQKAAV